MTKININKYSEIFKQEVVDLILSIQREEFGIQIDLEAQPDLKEIPAFYQKDEGNFWVASACKIVVGTIALLDIGNHCGALRKMFVKASYRGSKFGVGQALLNTLFEWAASKEFNTILLGTTEKFLAAQRFYEKNGFEEIDKWLLPKEFPVMPVDVKFYKYTVDNDKNKGN